MTILKVPREDGWFPEEEVLSIIRKVMEKGKKPRESSWYDKDARHHIHKALRHVLHYIDTEDNRDTVIPKEDYLALALTRLMMANLIAGGLI